MVDGLETDPPAPHRRSSRRPRTSFLPQRNSYPGRRRSSPSGRYVVIAEMIFPAMKMIASMKEKMGFVPGKILLEPEKMESRWKRIFFVPQKTFSAEQKIISVPEKIFSIAKKVFWLPRLPTR